MILNLVERSETHMIDDVESSLSPVHSSLSPIAQTLTLSSRNADYRTLEHIS